MFTLLHKFWTIVRIMFVIGLDSLALSKKHRVNEKTMLLVKVDGIGDYVLFRNYIEVLRRSKKYKEYKITLCGNVIWRNLAESFDKEFIHDFIWVDRKKIKTNILYRYNFLRMISQRRFEIAIQPTLSREFLIGDTIIRASTARKRIGSHGNYTSMRNWQKKISDRWYNSLIPTSAEPMTELQHNADFVKGLGVTILPERIPYIEIAQNMTQVIDADDYYVLIPGALWSHRQWPLENFVEIAERIYDITGLLGFICGSVDEKNLGEKLKDLSGAWL